MRIANLGHAVFAATMVAVGVLGFVRGDLVAVWQPVFSSVPARDTLTQLCASISLACGIGLLWRPAAALAARVLFTWLFVWFLLFRAPILLVAPAAAVSWENCGETAVIVAGAWVLHAGFVAGAAQRRPHAGSGTGLRMARWIYACALVAFGAAHFAYIEQTAGLVPGWLPAHVFIGYLTGCTYVAAGLAVLAGICGRWATALATAQMGAFTLLVWIPIVIASPTPGQWGEFVVSWTLSASSWVVAESYRHASWPAALRSPFLRASS